MNLCLAKTMEEDELILLYDLVDTDQSATRGGYVLLDYNGDVT